MGKLKVAIPFFLVFFSSALHAQVWNVKAPYGSTPRNRAMGFSIPSLHKGYITGGYDFTYEQDTWEYDTLTNVWTQRANFPGASTVAVAFTIGDKAYVGTGVGGGYTWSDAFYEYDPLADTWTAKTNFPGGPRGYGVGFSIGGKGYLGGGFTGLPGTFISYNDFYEYDPVNDSWTAVAPYPGAGAALGASGFSVEDKGYVGCGSSMDVYGNQILHDDFWEYDPNNNIWTQKADFGGGIRGEATTFSICDKGYLGLGYNIPHAAFTNDFWEYDPLTDSWIAIPNYGGAPRAYAPGFSIGKSGYAGTGFDGIIEYNDFWEFHKTYQADFSSSDTSICQGDTINFTDQSSFTATGWLWSFPGGTPASASIQNPGVTYNSPGTYSVTMLAFNNCDSDTVTYINLITVTPLPPQPSLGNDTTFCGSFQVQLDAGSTGFTYQWSTGDTSSTILVSAPDTFFVSAGNSCAVLNDTIIIGQESLPIVSAGNDVIACDVVVYSLEATGNAGNYLWSNGETDSITLVYDSGTYWVTSSNQCGTVTDSVNVLLLHFPSVNLGNDTSICDFNDFVLSTDTTGQILLWSTGATTSSIPVTAPGLYFVTATNECGSATDSILITTCEDDYLVPGAFTPNGDGTNDVLALIKIGDGIFIDFNIFNRWGQRIFYTADETDSWDGSYKNKMQGIGVYVYDLRYLKSGVNVLKKGTITLIR